MNTVVILKHVYKANFLTLFPLRTGFNPSSLQHRLALVIDLCGIECGRVMAKLTKSIQLLELSD